MSTALRLLLSTLMLWLAACTPSGEPRVAPPPPPTALEAAQAIFDQIAALRIQGLPDDAQMQVLAPLLSADLRQAMDAARAWQQGEIARMQREGSGDKPPFIEGDLFGSLFEGAHSTRAAASREVDGRVEVRLERSYGSGGERVQWQDRALLQRVGDGYRLDDIEYGGDWAFQAGAGTLRHTLKARE